MTDARRSAKQSRQFGQTNSCRRKQRFSSFKEAQRAAANHIRMERLEDGELVPYYCAYCGGHHIGTRQS